MPGSVQFPHVGIEFIGDLPGRDGIGEGILRRDHHQPGDGRGTFHFQIARWFGTAER
ncbi:hypothetical protein ACQEVF_22765 [Nonomuraea polychroma]|uniref:hypothetical protein n=1 Tax=Nonomuraea polychroma TaxID=46176 RepID=UPI003D8EAD56